MNTTVFVIDARNRERLVYAASATTLSHNPNAIVLRKGVTVGKLENVLIGRQLDCPILVMGAYQAQSSAGHVTPLGFNKFPKVVVVGGAGFGREVYDGGKRVRKGDALRPFSRPVEATLLPSGTRVQKMETHHGSNCATADAAFAGLKIMAETPCTAILVEGQSDCTSAISFYGDVTKTCHFPAEHREETFSKKSLVTAALRAATRPSKKAPEECRKPVAQQGWMFLALQILKAVATAKDGSRTAILSESVMEMVGDNLVAICDELIAEYVNAGWKFGINMELANQQTLAVSPNGVRVFSTSIKCVNRGAAYLYLEAATANSDEEKRTIKIRDLEAEISTKLYNMTHGSVSGHHYITATFADDQSETLYYGDGPSHYDAARGCNVCENNPGPNGEVNHGYRWLDAFDVPGRHFWPRLLEVVKMEAVHQTADCQEFRRDIWERGSTVGPRIIAPWEALS